MQDQASWVHRLRTANSVIIEHPGYLHNSYSSVTCCEVVPADSSVLGRLPALSLYCSDPLSSPPLGQDWKPEEPETLSASVAIRTAIAAATHYHHELTLANQRTFHVTCITVSRIHVYANLSINNDNCE